MTARLSSSGTRRTSRTPYGRTSPPVRVPRARRGRRKTPGAVAGRASRIPPVARRPGRTQWAVLCEPAESGGERVDPEGPADRSIGSDAEPSQAQRQQVGALTRLRVDGWGQRRPCGGIDHGSAVRDSRDRARGHVNSGFGQRLLVGRTRTPLPHEMAKVPCCRHEGQLPGTIGTFDRVTERSDRMAYFEHS